MHFEKGKVYLVNDINSGKLRHMKGDVKNHSDIFAFLNFPDNDCLKVDFCYEKLKKRNIKELRKEVSSIIGEDFALEDAEYSEKVMIILFLLLKENDIVAVNTAGMLFYSIDCLKERFTKITAFLNRILVVYNDK
ncbi:hypothetical protein [Chryseobacterium bernardetii]|uniref:hypothetical protein n=1 Tax=Chryseobacterium bernardetii TaxID=1241978 RepID=UPI003AF781ED